MRIDLLARRMAEVESGNNPNATGDDGRARGRWQMHPAWFLEWSVPRLGDTWDEAMARALLRYLRARALDGWSVFQVLGDFHLGHVPKAHADFAAALAYAARYGFSTDQLDSRVTTDNITFDGFYGYVSAA
jgi:hypothetical protein